tara:strand:- start:136 stop:324 length:189 start_codon:yes stop_codon:yes gene_type:complete
VPYGRLDPSVISLRKNPRLWIASVPVLVEEVKDKPGAEDNDDIIAIVRMSVKRFHISNSFAY